MKLTSSPGLLARASVSGLALVAVVVALTGCTPSTSTPDREAAANPDKPTVCFASLGDESIEVEWNLGRSDAQVHEINPRQGKWCAENSDTEFTFTSRAGIRWNDGTEQLIVEAGTGYQGIFARYLDTSNGVAHWVNMPFSDEDGEGGDNRIGTHRIITHSYKQGTRNKFVLFNVYSM